MITKQDQPPQSVFVPRRYAGQWIVWDRDRTVIVASGKTLHEAQMAAHAFRITEPGFEWVPPANRRIIGIRR